MRILMCCASYAPRVGGVQKVMQEVAEGLVKRGHDVTVATTKLKDRFFQELNGVKIREFAVSGNLAYGLKGDLDAYRRFIASNSSFDAILIKAAQQWTFDALWPILPQIKYRKVHIPCGYSSLYCPKYADYFRQMPDILRQFDHLIFYSNNYRDINFARQNGITDFSVIPNGASESEFSLIPLSSFRKKYGIHENNFVFLNVGNPPFSKGHLEVAQAYAKLKLPFSSTLILNGRFNSFQNPLLGSLSIKIKRQIKRTAKRILRRSEFPIKQFFVAINSIKQQSGKQVFIVDMPREELISAFFESNLFVFASHVEYSPLVLFESAAAGLPFLSAPVGNAEEIAQWTKGGEICPAEGDREGNIKVNPAVLADKMTRLAINREHLVTLGKQGRENWKYRYTWDKIALRYESILKGSYA